MHWYEACLWFVTRAMTYVPRPFVDRPAARFRLQTAFDHHILGRAGSSHPWRRDHPTRPTRCRDAHDAGRAHRCELPRDALLPLPRPERSRNLLLLPAGVRGLCQLVPTPLPRERMREGVISPSLPPSSLWAAHPLHCCAVPDWQLLWADLSLLRQDPVAR